MKDGLGERRRLEIEAVKRDICRGRGKGREKYQVREREVYKTFREGRGGAEARGVMNKIRNM